MDERGETELLLHICISWGLPFLFPLWLCVEKSAWTASWCQGNLSPRYQSVKKILLGRANPRAATGVCVYLAAGWILPCFLFALGDLDMHIGLGEVMLFVVGFWPCRLFISMEVGRHAGG